jgi:hypothetical protein
MRPNLYVRLTYKSHNDPHRYNLPTGDEIAVILPDATQATDSREVIVQLKGVHSSVFMREVACMHPFIMCYFFTKVNLARLGIFLIEVDKR